MPMHGLKYLAGYPDKLVSRVGELVAENRLCEHMEPDYGQLEFDARLYLTQVELGGPLYRQWGDDTATTERGES